MQKGERRNDHIEKECVCVWGGGLLSVESVKHKSRMRLGQEL